MIYATPAWACCFYASHYLGDSWCIAKLQIICKIISKIICGKPRYWIHASQNFCTFLMSACLNKDYLIYFKKLECPFFCLSTNVCPQKSWRHKTRRQPRRNASKLKISLDGWSHASWFISILGWSLSLKLLVVKMAFFITCLMWKADRLGFLRVKLFLASSYHQDLLVVFLLCIVY